MPETVARKAPAKKVAAKKAVPNPRTNPENVTTATTVSGAEREPANRPESFKALKLDELRHAAEIFGVDDDPNPDVILANLAEDGITWNMYVKQMKLPGWENLPEDEEIEPRLLNEDEWDEAEEETVEEVRTASPTPDLEEGKYLIKFVGQNWYFERGRYSFSKDNPYALMNARDAQSALVEEPTKFRQAFPAELESYYDRG